MADIALVTNTTEGLAESIQQRTAITGEEIPPLTPVRFDPTTGNFVISNATNATEAKLYGISTNVRTVKAGMPLTAIRRGLIAGFNFTQNYGADIFLSNTDGKLADAPGTVSVRVGQIISAWAQPIGVAADKLLSVEL